MGSAAGARVLTVVLSGLFGLLIGSFLNVVIHRVPRGMSIVRPPSHCPSCGTELSPLDNIPLVSWVVLRGRCRTCGVKISPRYPLIELTTALVFGGIALALPGPIALPSLLLVAGASIAAVATDLDGAPIPWSLAGAVAAGAASLAAVSAALGEDGRLGWAALGAGLAGIFSALAIRVTEFGRAPAAPPDWSLHSTSAPWLRVVLVVGALGWAAGWLWPVGGPVLAGWTLVAIGVGALAGLNRGARTPGLVLVAFGALGLVLAGAALQGP